MARPSYSPTDESRRLVKALAATGVRHTDIAEKLSVSHDTLTKYYADELRDGRVDANAKVAQALYQQAVNGNTTAMIFWLKTRAGWKEAIQHVGDEDGGPIRHVFVWENQPAL